MKHGVLLNGIELVPYTFDDQLTATSYAENLMLELGHETLSDAGIEVVELVPVKP